MSDKYKNKQYYIKKVSIGLLSLLNTMFVLQLGLYTLDRGLMKGHVYLESDWFVCFITARRLKKSIESKDVYDITIDATSFYIFLRIYYDSLAVIIHYLFKKMYPRESRKWPTSRSFEDQLKWLEKNEDSDFKKFKKAIQDYGYLKLFREMREIRNNLKETAIRPKSSRLNLEIQTGLPVLGKLQKHIAECLFSTISLTDFIGDYFFNHLKELRTVERKDYAYNGYPASFMHKGEIDIYKWYINKA